MNSESAARAYELAVQVVKVDHFAVRTAGKHFVRAVQSVGRERLGPEGLALVKAYDEFARSLAHTFHELEEEVVDRVQVLHAQKRMAPGALALTLPRWRELSSSLVAHGSALDELSTRFPNVPMPLRESLTRFVSSVHACVDAYRTSLEPALAPYFGPLEMHDA